MEVTITPVTTGATQPESMLKGSWYSVPVAPGVPLNAMTIAKVGGSIMLTSAGCPWAAFALNSAFTALEAKDGGLTWKQAAVQVGINAAITYASMGAGDLAGTAFENSKSFGAQLAVAGARSTVTTFGGVVSSSVQYNPDGSMGWNQDHFSDSRTWSQAGLTFATSFAASAATIGMREGLKLNSNLLSTTMSTTINTMGANVKVGEGGGWNWQGFDNIDGQKAVITGAANYVSSTATGGMQDRYMQSMVSGMINAYALKGFSEIFENYAGRDFGDEYSLNRAISVDTLSISAEGAYMDTKNRLTVALMSDKQKAELTKEEKLKHGMIDEGGWTLHKMGRGLLDAVTSLGTIGTSIANEVRTIGGDIMQVGKGLGSALDIFKPSPSTDWGELMKDASMQKWVVEMMYKDKDFAMMADELGLEPEMKKLGMYMEKKDKYDEKIQRVNEANKDNDKWFTVFDNSKEAGDYLMTKKFLGENIDANDAKYLSQTLWQAKDKPLSKELAEMISANKDVFKKQEGLDVNNKNSINEFSNKLAKSSCFLNTLFQNIVLSPITDNVPTSMGDMYKTLYNKGLIAPDGINAYNINSLSSIQTMVDAVVGKDVLAVDGFSIKQGLKTSDVFRKLNSAINNNLIITGGVRIDGHSFMVHRNGTYDSGRPNNTVGPRPYGSKITDWAGRDNTSSIYYLLVK